MIVSQVWDKEGIILIPDHYIFTADPRANRNVDILRDFAQQQNIKYFYDITDRYVLLKRHLLRLHRVSFETKYIGRHHNSLSSSHLCSCLLQRRL